MKTLTLMETFAVVVETGSFTAAAEKLRLSKSFVSKQITLLEQDLNTRLLYRTTRKLSLSDEGARFYQRCKNIMAEAESARAEILESKSAPQGKIKITVPQSLIISGIGLLLLDFQKKYPDIQLYVIVSGQVENLVEEGIDIALRVGQVDDSSLISRKLADCSFQVAASPEYLEKWGEPCNPSNLKQHNCLVYGDSKTNWSWPFRMPNGETITVKVKGNLICNDGMLIVHAMLQGRGIGFGPSFLFKKYIDEGKIQLLLTEYYNHPTAITALYPHNRHLSRRVRVLIDFLVENLTM